jgi:hypothetical protein
MKATNIIYWVVTVIVALMMAYSAYAYLTQPAMVAGFQHLGYPDYFRIELAIAKLIGVVLLLVPVPPRIKEWAYAGFVITFISAFIAHTVSGDPAMRGIMALVFTALILVSYFTYHKRLKTA